MNHPTLRILWWALLGSQVVYLALPLLVQTPLGSGSATVLDGVALALAVLTVVIIAGSLRYRRRALVTPIQAGQLDPRSESGLQRAMQPFIVNLALSESVAIYGLVLGLLAGGIAYQLPFALAALALTWAHRPTAPELAPPMRRASDVAG